MPQLGADVEQLDSLARKFDEEAGKIEGMVSSIGSQLGAAWWKGGDADRFTSDWNGTISSQLRNACESLRQAATSVRNQASQQRTTSQA